MDSKQFERLQDAVQWVVDEAQMDLQTKPYRHDQMSWVIGAVEERVEFSADSPVFFSVICPTACCLAGNAVAAHGDKLVALLDQHTDEPVHAEYCVDESGALRHIAERAQELMGLSADEAAVIFEPNLDAEQIAHLARHYTARHGYTLELV